MNQQATPNVTKWCDELKFNRFHGLVLMLAGMTLIFDGYDSQIIAYVMPQMLKEWHLSPVKAGSIASYGFVGLMIGAAGFGMIADRVGRKATLMLALLAFSTFSGAAFWAPDFGTFCVLRFLAGLGMGGAMPLTITLVSEYSPARIRGKAVTAMFGGFTFGWAVAALIAMIFIPIFGWRVVLLMGFIPVILLPFLKWLLPESVRFLASKGRYDEAIVELRKVEVGAGVAPIGWTKESFSVPGAQTSAGIGQLFTSRLAVMTVLVWLTYFFNLLIVYGLATWLPSLLVKAGFSVVRSYSYGLIQAIGASAGGIFLGFLMDKFGRKSALVMTYFFGGIAVWLFGAVSNNTALYIIGAATGVFIIGAQIAQHVVSGEIYPTNVRSTGVGWALTVGRFGSIVGPLLGGFLQMAGFSFSQYFIVFAIPSFICMVLVMFYRVNVKGEDLETVAVKLTAKAASQHAP
ncbi:MAG: MFS transporter [Syntrophorhabdales bacterium]|jgi:AAHS family benzoate transporter-like MFS transporter